MLITKDTVLSPVSITTIPLVCGTAVTEFSVTRESLFMKVLSNLYLIRIRPVRLPASQLAHGSTGNNNSQSGSTWFARCRVFVNIQPPRTMRGSVVPAIKKTRRSGFFCPCIREFYDLRLPSAPIAKRPSPTKARVAGSGSSPTWLNVGSYVV